MTPFKDSLTLMRYREVNFTCVCDGLLQQLSGASLLGHHLVYLLFYPLVSLLFSLVFPSPFIYVVAGSTLSERSLCRSLWLRLCALTPTERLSIVDIDDNVTGMLLPFALILSLPHSVRSNKHLSSLLHFCSLTSSRSDLPHPAAPCAMWACCAASCSAFSSSWAAGLRSNTTCLTVPVNA